MKILGLLNEILSAEEFHSTSLSNLLNILRTDTINLSSGISANSDDLQNKMFFLSLSRTGFPKLAYGQNTDWFCRIVFNGAKLNHNYASKPVDYWEIKSRHPDSFEYEDRLITDKSSITNVSKYILRIDILTHESMNQNALHKVKEIMELAKLKNIPVFVYENKNDLVKKVNPINDKIKQKDTSGREEEFKFNGWGIDLNKIVALLMYSDKYLRDNGYDLFKQDLTGFLKDNDIPQVDEYKTYEYLMELYFGGRDFLPSILANLHTYLKAGSNANPNDRKYLDLLVGEMRKYKVRNVQDFVNIKTRGIKPKGSFIDYRGKIGLYELSYNYDTEKWDLWEMVPYDRSLNNLRIYFNGWGYGGHLSKEDTNIFFDMRSQGKTWGDFMNYLLNKYTIEKVQEIIHKSGYSQTYDRYEYKLAKV
jgi:hypothetical protein